MLKKLVRLLVLLTGIGIWLAGCVMKPVTMIDPEASQEYNGHVVARLEGERIAGQTITLRRTGIQGISVWLRTESNASGKVTLRLYRDPENGELLASASLEQSAIASGGMAYFRFDRPVQGEALVELVETQDLVSTGSTNGVSTSSTGDVSTGSTNRVSTSSTNGVSTGSTGGEMYFFTIETDGSQVEVLGRLEDAYPDGSLYQVINDALTPVSADMAFHVNYDYGWAALVSDFADALPKAWFVLPLGALLLLPGWLLLDALGLLQDYDGGERVALSVGLSLAIMPLALLWSSVAGLRWNAPMLMGVALALTTLGLWRFGKQAIRWQKPGKLQPANLQNLALWAVFGLSMLVRLAMVRDLAAPAWVDSVHHATITRLIMEQGQFPKNYLPYLDVAAQEYHAGYHAGLAAFSALSRLDLAQAMLLYGQVLNALAVFAVYALAKFLTQDRRAGIIAGLVAGLLTLMPAYYTSWGRYTQLAGLLILPAVVILFRGMIEKVNGKVTGCAATAIAAAGMFLVHYRVAAFTGLLLLALFVCDVRWDRTWNFRRFRDIVGWGSVASGAAFGLALPWAWPTITNVFAPILAAEAQPGKLFGDFSWGYLTAAMGVTALALAGVGLIWGLLRGQRWAAALALWVGLLLLMANLGPLGMPGGGIITNTTAVEIVFFIPIAILAGYAIGQGYETGRGWWPTRWQRLIPRTLNFLLIGLSLAGAQKLLPVLRTSTLLFRQADHAAMKWIDYNVPPDETVLINPFLWGYNLYAGSDGGFWISPLAGRKTMPPPVLYGMESLEQRTRVNQICQRVIQNGENAAALWEILQVEGIHYIYVGGRGGPISAAKLNASPLFETLYQEDGTWVFQTNDK